MNSREDLEASLIEKLQAGLLVATGYDSRLAIDAPPVTIPADRWPMLKPDFKSSTVAGPGMQITGILVRSPEGHAKSFKGDFRPMATKLQAAPGKRGSPASSSTRTGAPSPSTASRFG